MENKIKNSLAATMLAVTLASCSLFSSEKKVAQENDTPPDSTEVVPADSSALEQDSTVVH